MKKNNRPAPRFVLSLALLLCLALAACAHTGEVTPTPEPTPEPTSEPTPAPTPEPWEADPGQFIQGCLELDFAVDGRIPLCVNIDPGSMPLREIMHDSEVGQAIRDLFAAYEWECVEKPAESDGPDPVVGIGAYLGVAVAMYDMEDAPRQFYVSTYDNVISLYAADWDKSFYFRAEGAENLCRDLIVLCPNPYAQATTVYSPLQKTAADTAKRFLDDFFASMAESGHITDYQLLEGYVLDPENMVYRIRFRLKPANPEWEFWSGNSYDPLNASGWTQIIEMRFWLETDGERVRFWI